MPPTNTEQAAILVVDDEISLRNTFRIFLQRAGYKTVIAVGSFTEAVKAVSSQMFDLIICDIVLESHSGIELLRRFRQLGVNCPVVMITGYPHVETASEAVRLGAFDYLAKPVEKEALLKTARLAIQQYHLEQAKHVAERAREQYRLFLETIFKSVSDSIISVDASMNIMKVNNAASVLFQQLQLDLFEGGNLTAILGKSQGLQEVSGDTIRVIKTGSELTDHRLECFLDETCKVLSVCISPLGDGTGKPVGAVLVLRDMTLKEQNQISEKTYLHRIIGASPAMQNVYLLIEKIGRVDTSALITGASGTGKELVVHALHQESARRDKPLVMVDCSAIQDNLLESELFGHKKGSFTGAEENRTGRILQAEGGTLFLDEIGDISKIMQLRLLRFLQEKTFYPVGSDKEIQVDVRVIAATNVDLKASVENGSFREDLYFRLLIIEIPLPLLSARNGDIELLTYHFIHLYAPRIDKKITGISEQAMALLCQYNWPGNVRQLEHSIERACILCQDATISTEHLPAEIVQHTQVNQATTLPAMELSNETQTDRIHQYTLTEQEQQSTEEIIAALTKAGGNKAKAARILKIDRSTLYRKMRELHIDIDLFTS
ncbi:MAG: response regulator [Desulfobulbaceae bacterium]|nr:response regulator [Desulfobulbaceae bacterium]